jgi:hypothetical protein
MFYADKAFRQLHGHMASPFSGFSKGALVFNRTVTLRDPWA